MSIDRYVPAGLARNDLAAVIGLLSDTHMPMRRRTLPENLGDILRGVDFLLHAGDVGELWVLDQLSTIAPVIAVHGNDDSDDAQRELPFQQIIGVAGQRILLWHSHYADWREEMASRVHNDLRRSLQRSINQARQVGAKIAVIGHWHIPLTYRAGDLLLINPGALASGNEFTRMLINTLALLFITRTGEAHVVHIDLAAPEQPYVPEFDWDAGFTNVGNLFARSILAPELAPAVHFMRTNFSRDEIMAIRPIIAAKAMPIWERASGELTLADVEEAITNTSALSPDLHARTLAALRMWQNHK